LKSLALLFTNVLDCRLFALILLSTVLIAPTNPTAQGAVAVLAVLIYVGGFAVGLGAGMSVLLYLNCVYRALSLSMFHHDSVLVYYVRNYANQITYQGSISVYVDQLGMQSYHWLVVAHSYQ
jgi:hypothetical protein